VVVARLKEQRRVDSDAERAGGAALVDRDRHAARGVLDDHGAPGAHLTEEVVADDFVLMLGVDLVNFPKFPKADDTVTYPKKGLDIRYQLDTDSGGVR